VYLETYQITIKLTRKLPCDSMPPQLVERLRAAMQSLQNEPKNEA
jgi:muconolactone delta-isomerase